MARPVNTRIVIGPNASLSAAQAAVFFGSICLVCLGIAIGFALQGLWPVLPFAGLELAAVGAALWVALRRNAYREVIHLEAHEVRVEFGQVGVGAQSVVRMVRPLTRALLETGPLRHSPTRLVLACGGQQAEVGRSLTDEERARLAARLKQLLAPAWSAGMNDQAGHAPGGLSTG